MAHLHIVRAPNKSLFVSLLSIGLMAGLCIPHWGYSLGSVWMLLLAAVFCYGIFRPACLVVFALLLGVFIGYIRAGSFLKDVTGYRPYFGKIVSIWGVVTDDPSILPASELQFHVSDITLKDKSLPGKIRVKTRSSLKIGRGDTIQATGTLFKTLGTARQGSMAFADIKLKQTNKSPIERFRKKFFHVIETSLTQPQASLGLGYLVGLRTSIPKGLEDMLAATGLSHIVAVSGYNLTIIVAASRRLLAKKSAYQSVVFSGILIIFFVLITGWSAPISRAVIISSLGLLAWYYGKIISGTVLLLLSGAITAFISPFYIWGDASWYLSFLAFFGILIFSPLITARLRKQKPPSFWRQILIDTLSAQIFALPYILYLFGSVSIVAPLANVLTLPLIPFIMFSVAVGGVLGIFAPVLGTLIGYIPYYLITYQMWVIEKLAKLPWAVYEFKITAASMVILYVFLASWTTLLWLSHQRNKSVTQGKVEWGKIA